ncbi:MAG: hypothetical protein BWX52_02018 [Bacteroidetes bacterium ADurb.Bin013]|nr:MAG: hypothetical protein BWX52_02018 [Bacteroidetes bacterium ADurb.Bin013]
MGNIKTPVFQNIHLQSCPVFYGNCFHPLCLALGVLVRDSPIQLMGMANVIK